MVAAIEAGHEAGGGTIKPTIKAAFAAVARDDNSGDAGAGPVVPLCVYKTEG